MCISAGRTADIWIVITHLLTKSLIEIYFNITAYMITFPNQEKYLRFLATGEIGQGLFP